MGWFSPTVFGGDPPLDHLDALGERLGHDLAIPSNLDAQMCAAIRAAPADLIDYATSLDTQERQKLEDALPVALALTWLRGGPAPAPSTLARARGLLMYAGNARSAGPGIRPAGPGIWLAGRDARLAADLARAIAGETRPQPSRLATSEPLWAAFPGLPEAHARIDAADRRAGLSADALMPAISFEGGLAVQGAASLLMAAGAAIPEAFRELALRAIDHDPNPLAGEPDRDAYMARMRAAVVDYRPDAPVVLPEIALLDVIDTLAPDTAEDPP